MKRIAVMCACLLTTSAGANFDLIYDPETGSLTMDTFGGRVLTYVIENRPYLYGESGPFLYENHNSPFGSDSFFLTSTLQNLSDSHFTAPFLTEPWNLGNVLQPGLSESEYLAIVNHAIYVEDFGQGIVRVDGVIVSQNAALPQFDLIYGESVDPRPPVDPPVFGTTELQVGIQGLFDLNGQVLASSSKTMAVIDVDGDGLAGFNLDNWAGGSFLPDSADVIVSDSVLGLWYEATGDGDYNEDRAPDEIANSVLDSTGKELSSWRRYNVDVVSASGNDDQTAGAGDELFLFYFPDLPIDATEPGEYQSFGVVSLGYLSNPDQITNFYSIGRDTTYLASYETGKGTVAEYVTVPEPTSLGLLASAGLLVLRRRRSRG